LLNRCHSEAPLKTFGSSVSDVKRQKRLYAMSRRFEDAGLETGLETGDTADSEVCDRGSGRVLASHAKRRFVKFNPVLHGVVHHGCYVATPPG
jgi:hypothetical protein